MHMLEGLEENQEIFMDSSKAQAVMETQGMW